MGITTRVTVWCDKIGCHRHTDYGMQTVRGEREKASLDGWTYYYGQRKDFCPDHRNDTERTEGN